MPVTSKVTGTFHLTTPHHLVYHCDVAKDEGANVYKPTIKDLPGAGHALAFQTRQPARAGPEQLCRAAAEKGMGMTGATHFQSASHLQYVCD